MSAELLATETNIQPSPRPSDDAAEPSSTPNAAEPNDADANDEEEEDDDDDDEEEPKLKYAKLTGSVTGVYRNGDSTSAFMVAGDKMLVGTHNGSIHALAVPSLQTLRTYRAHQASVTSISVSPVPPPPALVKGEGGSNTVLSPTALPGKHLTAPASRQASNSSPRTASKSPQSPVPNAPSNQIYVGTSSMDGHVCVSSLVDPADVLLRNFARPVNSVALSPDYRNDRTYLSGGLAGSLILTVGGKAGVSQDANTTSTAAAASGWLGTIGLGGNTGKDTVLHSGEGAISTIKWSLTGKWVVWVNEEGIKICRSHLKLGSEESEDAWRRIAHAARPNRQGWEEMASVWKGRCEWIDDKHLESESLMETTETLNGINGHGTVQSTSSAKAKRQAKVEKLVVGWGDTAWILHVHESRATTAGRRQVGSADIVHKLQFRDCIISGISFYTPSLLAILAYRTRDDDDKPIAQHNQQDSSPKKGRQHRHTRLAPQLRLINVVNGEEVELDELSRVSRFETLAAQDFHLGTLYIPPPIPENATKEQQRGALEGLWDAAGGGYATRLFSSNASIRSGSSEGPETSGRSLSLASPSRGSGSARGVEAGLDLRRRQVDAHPYMLQSGLKLFVQSPYDCVLAVKRGLSDHLEWLLEHQQYGGAWKLIDEHPEAVTTGTDAPSHGSSQPASPSRTPVQGGSLAEFFADSSSTKSAEVANLRAHNSASQKEKRRIGDLWLQQLISANEWAEAGPVAGQVLGTSSRWEHWVWTFAQANKFDEITPYIPSTALKPPLPSLVYEVVLGHYIVRDVQRLGRLLDDWDAELFDVRSVITAIEDRLDSGEVSEADGVDWRILMDSLARLYLVDGRARDSLKCYIRLQDAEKAFGLIREEKLLDTAAEDIPGLIMLRVSKEQMRSASLPELEDATAEATQLLVEEAHRGTVAPSTVVKQLQRKGDAFQPFLFFYFRALWNWSGKTAEIAPKRIFDQTVAQGHAMVEDHADLAVRLFAEYDRALLLTFLKASSVYNYDRAAEICERRHYIPELVHILSKIGQTKKALWLIIGELGDVSQAISFAKDNPDLWDDLLEYSMNKPTFIRGLLEQVGAIDPGAAAGFNPIEVVRRIPEGLEIEGLKGGIQKLVREFEIQLSISAGVAKVLSGEVGMGMNTVRAGRKKGVRFEVVSHEKQISASSGADDEDVDLAVHDVPTRLPGDQQPLRVRPSTPRTRNKKTSVMPGHCVGCHEPFSQHESETLVGFACGHVYHLSCLLDSNPDTSDSRAAEDVLRQLGRAHAGDERGDEGAVGARSVGAKVAHAHLIQSVVKGGCQQCAIPEE